MGEERSSVQGEAEAAIHGDTLESILTHVPLIDLLPASHVSKSWKSAVSTSLRCFNRTKPWLTLHTQATRSPYSTTAHAYDPRSNIWVQIHQPPIKYLSALRSSHSTLLYMLSPSKFSFSFDPLHLTWHHVDPPLMWRTDPIVATIGRRVIIAGGTCYFEDDPLAVEMYDLETHTWDTCTSLPEIFKDSAASIWLSVAVDSAKMYVVQRSTGVTCSFDPCAKAWHGPYDLRPDDRSVCGCAIGFANSRLILIGFCGENEKVEKVKLWEVDVESLEIGRAVGEMPEELVKKLGGEDDMITAWSMTVNMMGDMVYMNNGSVPEVVVACEVGGGGGCSWSSIKNMVVKETWKLRERLVFTCCNVGLGDLQRAMKCKGRKFSSVKERM